jgi:hypothetical protein
MAFVLSISLYASDFAKNKDVFFEVAKLLHEDIPKLENTLIELKDKEINLGFYTKHSEYSQSLAELNLILKNELVKTKKINIISENYDEYASILESQSNSKYEDIRLIGQLKKTKYLLKIDLDNITYSRNLYMKNEIKGTLSVEVVDLSRGSTVYASYMPIDYSKKIPYIRLVYLMVGLFFSGILLSIITKRYYTLKIFSFIIVFLSLVNIYYFFII